MRRYFVSYRYETSFRGDRVRERYSFWSVERETPITSDEDMEAATADLTERVAAIRAPLSVHNLVILFWRPFEDPE